MAGLAGAGPGLGRGVRLAERVSAVARQTDDVASNPTGGAVGSGSADIRAPKARRTTRVRVRRGPLAPVLSNQFRTTAIVSTADLAPANRRLVSLDRKPARNSDRMLSIPLSHFSVGPSPLEWVGVELVVLLP
jgi:hypothetical protein